MAPGAAGLLNSSTGPTHVPKKFLKLPGLKSFSICHLFLHFKGQNFAQKFSNVHLDDSKESKIAVKDFQSISKLLKKRRGHKIEEGLSRKLGLLGTFLDHQFFLTNCTAIVLIGRHDFLPPDSKEIADFSEHCSQLPLLFEKYFWQRKSFKIEKIVQAFFSELPLFLEIWNLKENKLVWKAPSDSLQEGLPFQKIEITPVYQIRYQKSSEHLDVTTNLFHRKRMGLLGDLLNTLRHELSNPLFGIDLALSSLVESFEDPEDKEFVRLMAKNVHRCQDIMDNVSGLYGGQARVCHFSLKQVLEEAMLLARSETKHLQILVDSDALNWEDSQCFLLNQTWVVQIFFNLIINSAQAASTANMDQKPILHISSKLAGDSVQIEFLDNGPGINSSEIGHLFTPFFTTKPKGVGLGLVFSQSLCSKMGGDLQYRAITDRDKDSSCLGACFIVRLPFSENYRANSINWNQGNLNENH